MNTTTNIFYKNVYNIIYNIIYSIIYNIIYNRMASIVDPPPNTLNFSRSDAIAGGKKKSNMEMYHALQATNKGKSSIM